jgi:hypothetical protein
MEMEGVGPARSVVRIDGSNSGCRDGVLASKCSCLDCSSVGGFRDAKIRTMGQEEIPANKTAPVRKVVQISTMVHPEKDWAFIALCDDGSLWLYHGSWSRIENIPQTDD